MLHATCDECGKQVNLPINPNGSVEIILEEPEVVEDDDGQEVEVGGEALEVAVVDPSTGEAVDKHLCRECLVFKIASVSGPNAEAGESGEGEGDGPDDEGGSDDDDDGDSGEPAPVEPTGKGEEKG